MIKGMVQAAVRDGHKPDKFRAAAQRYANSTWVWVLVSAAVWYFAGWGWMLLPVAAAVGSIFFSIQSTRVAEELEKVARPQEVQQILQAYGAVLENSAPVPGCVADINKLPYPKEVIKEAILHAISVSDPEIREQLASSYIALADWQEGVGEQDIGIDIQQSDMLSDLELAKKVMQQSGGKRERSLIAKSILEAEDLNQELVDRGLI